MQKLPACWALALASVPMGSQTHPAPAAALSDRVLVVYNEWSQGSRQVADHYVAARKIPAAHRCGLKLSDHGPRDETATVRWEDFEITVKRPIQKCLDRIGRKKILYIVLTYGTPYRLEETPVRFGISVDQHLADIWDQLGGAGRRSNPYYGHSHSAANRYPTFRSLADYRDQANAEIIYSVWRLDAASPVLARGLVDKALEAESSGLAGQACFDRRYGSEMNSIRDASYGSGDWDVHRAAEFAREAGFPVVEDINEAEFGTPPAPKRCDNAALYAGWYSLEHYNDAFTWSPGAIGVHLDSASAANPRGGANWSANAIQKGITVTAGALTEPDLFGLPHVDGVLRDLLAGASVGDAFLRHTPWLKWMIVQIGDPLYRPLAHVPVPAAVRKP